MKTQIFDINNSSTTISCTFCTIFGGNTVDTGYGDII